MATIEVMRFEQSKGLGYSEITIRADDPSTLEPFQSATGETIDGKLVITPPGPELEPFQPIPGRYAQAEDGRFYRCVGEKHNGLWVFECVTSCWSHFHFRSNGQHAYSDSIKGLTHLMPPDFDPHCDNLNTRGEE